MANTANKDLERPAHGSEVDTWDQPMNDNYGKIDLALGGSTTLNATGVTGAVALTVTQVTPPTIIVSGLPIGSVVYEMPTGVGGAWSVSNATTGGFVIAFTSLAGGDVLEIPAGVNTLISCDGTSRGMVYSSQTDPADRALTLVESQAPAGTLSYVAFTDLTAGDYQIRFRNMRSAAESPYGLQFSTDNGATWISSAGDYNFVGTLISVDKTSATGQATGSPTNSNVSGADTYIPLGSGSSYVDIAAGTAGMGGVIDINVMSGVPTTAHLVGEADTVLSGTHKWQSYDIAGNARANNTLKNAVRIVSTNASVITATDVSLYRYSG